MKDKFQLIRLAEQYGFTWRSEFDETTVMVKRQGGSSHYLEIETESETGAGMVNGKTGNSAIVEIKNLAKF